MQAQRLNSRPEKIENVNYERILKRVAASIEPEIGKGEVARYLPPLATVDPNQFGIALHTTCGQLFTVGAAHRRFSIQGISKLFSLALAINLLGDEIWTRLDREPSGAAFNSLMQLEVDQGKPRNPFTDAGALVVVDILASHFAQPENAIMQFIRRLAGDESVDIDRRLARAEQDACHRNIAMAHCMKSFGNLCNSVDEVIRSYSHQCSTMMSCAQLATAGAFLANAGACAATGTHIITVRQAKRIKVLMSMCGTYDAAGDFAYRVGLPAKSGMGGGIMAVVPGRATVCVWSPRLDATGNSHAGCMALERLADLTGWSVY